MKTNRFLITALAAVFTVLLFNQTKAQVTFNHAAGGGLYSNKYGGSPAIFYHPRLNFVELGGRRASVPATLSAGIPLGLGFNFNSRTGGGFCLDAPITVDINLGHAANPDADNVFGGFVGAGFGYNMMAGSDDFGGFVSKNMGPVVHGGARVMIKGRSVGLRVSYMINIKKNPDPDDPTSASVIGLNIFYTFGEF